jgi:hypothetical protein
MQGKHKQCRFANYSDAPDENIDCELGWRQYKHHLIDKNDNVDVFLHTRDPHFDERAIDLYEPKKHEVEPYFDFDLDKHCVAAHEATGYPVDAAKEHSQRCWSRWYSAHKSIKLKSDYEKENNFKYDWVFLARFDYLAFEDFIFSDYNTDYFYLPWSNFMGTDRSLYGTKSPDLWFFSDSEKMDKFSEIYLEMKKGVDTIVYDDARAVDGSYIFRMQAYPGSIHTTTKNQLLEMERLGHEMRYVLNMDVDSCGDIVRCAVTRYRKEKYWDYNEETKLYSLKPEYAEHINKETLAEEVSISTRPVNHSKLIPV